VGARWTDRILDESFRNILANRPDLVPGSLDRTRELMNRALRDVLVTGYEGRASTENGASADSGKSSRFICIPTSSLSTRLISPLGWSAVCLPSRRPR
jgi:hypothetical protein